jgi:uncharacterized protein YcfJ
LEEKKMRKLIILASVAAMAAPAFTLTVVPTEASASARDCRTYSTVGGGVGGALIGNGLSHGSTAGTLLGGLGGAVIGHEVARNNCKDRPAVQAEQTRRYRASCRTETHYRDHRPYQVRLCEGRVGVWRPA